MVASTACFLLCEPEMDNQEIYLACLAGCIAAIDVGLLDSPAPVDEEIPFEDLTKKAHLKGTNENRVEIQGKRE